jgi:DNA-binding NarL/FixJ family response regulator
MPIRILLADDHVMVRQGLRALLEQAGMLVVGEASDGQEALQAIASTACASWTSTRRRPSSATPSAAG